MKIKRLILENFMAIKHARIDLDDKGLVLIQGENKDDPSASSNGAGKSSVVDGVMWALYGETARGISGDEVINDTVGKNCRTVLTVEDDGKEYVISRHRKHKEGKNALWLFRDKNDITKGTNKLTQAAIESVIGCTSDVFKAAIYAGQEAMPDLPGMTDRHLKQLVEEAAGIDKLESAYKIARDDMNSLKSIIAVDETKLDGLRTSVKSGLTEAKRLGESLVAWKDDQAKRHEASCMDVAKANESLETANAGVAKLDRAGLEKQLKEVREKINSVSGEQAEHKRLSGEVTAAERKVSEIEYQLKTQKSAIVKDKDNLDEIEGMVGAPCDECGRPHDSSSLESTAEVVKARLREASASAKDLMTSLKTAKQASQNASDALATFTASMTNLDDERSAESAILAEIETVKVAEELRDKAERLVEETKAKTTAIFEEKNPYEELVSEKKTALKGLRVSIDEANESLTKLQKDFQIAKDVVEVFGPAGVRAHILDSVTPFLNERTTHYLGILSDGNISAEWSTLSKTKKGDLSEKFNIAVTNVKGAKGFAGLSGGEKRKVRLSTAMALQDLVAARATKPIDLFIGDEIDDALDTAGLERLMGILEVKARERGTVMLISHNDLKDWVRNSMTVVKEGGSSTIEEAA